jgi:phosphatidyl-myo-inositol alpha-mannosyltransferase
LPATDPTPGDPLRERRLEIWLVSQSYLPFYGGITEHVWHLAERLAARGHRVSILTGRPLRGAARPSDPDPSGVTVHRLGRTLRLPSNGARACVTLGPGWGRRLAALRVPPPEIVHVQSPLEPWLPLWALRALPGVKIGTFHTGGSHRHWGYRHGARLLDGPLAALRVRLAVSREAARYVALHFPGEYRVLPNGVDLVRFHPRPAGAPRELRALYVGRCDPRKGLRILLDAMIRLGNDADGRPRLGLRIAGDGPERGPLERAARRAGLAVEFAGGVTRADLPRLYREADLFVAPSTDGESFGVSLLEALASGLPVVASRIPGYAETLRDSGAGLLFEPGSPEALAAALRALAGDRVRRAAMGEMGRRYAARYDWDRLAGEVETVYLEALLGSPPRRAAAPQPLTIAG